MTTNRETNEEITMEKFLQYIGGAFVDGADTFPSINPANGMAWAQMPAADKAQTNAAVDAAKSAFGEWSQQIPAARARVLYKIADVLAARAAELAKLETQDTGKIIRETESQIGYAAEYYRYFAGLADKTQGAHLPIDKADMEVWTRREAIGVVAAVVPWNSQMFLTAVKVAPALAAGCTMVVKASEDAPAPLLAFGRILHDAGLPPGVVNIICGFGGECGAALVSNPHISRVAFTGGADAARKVIIGTANNFAHTTTELGGKSPVIVFDDADVPSAANAIVAGVFAASGQSCVSCSRLLVQSGIKDKLLKLLKQKAQAITIGDPLSHSTEMGPLCTKRQLQNILSAIDEAAQGDGANVLCGGAQPDIKGGGYYFQPTILECRQNNVRAEREELFGPVLCARSFADEAEAITMANDSDYGLACGVFTKDLTRAHRISRAVRAGVVWLNTYRAISPMAPFGGFGMSGYGREGGMESILDYTRQKAIWLRTSDSPIADPFVMR